MAVEGGDAALGERATVEGIEERIPGVGAEKEVEERLMLSRAGAGEATGDALIGVFCALIPRNCASFCTRAFISSSFIAVAGAAGMVPVAGLGGAAYAGTGEGVAAEATGVLEEATAAGETPGTTEAGSGGVGAGGEDAGAADPFPGEDERGAASIKPFK